MDTFLPTGTVVVQVVGCDEDGASLRSDSIMIILADNVDVRQKIFEVNSFAVFASGRLRTQLNGFLALVGKALADVLSFNAANPKKKKVAESAISFGWTRAVQEIARNAPWAQSGTALAERSTGIRTARANVKL